MRSPAAVLAALAAVAVMSRPLGAQEYHQPAYCPEAVDPGLVAYPTHIIHYDDGDHSGNFQVDMLWDANFVARGYRSDVTYVTDPEVPKDVRHPATEWRFAAVDVDCYWYNVGFDRVRVVEERALHGIVFVPDQLACSGGGSVDNPPPGDNSGFAADVSSADYDPLDPVGPTSGSGCDPGGGGAADTGLTCHDEYAYLDELVAGEWVQIWEGYVMVCE